MAVYMERVPHIKDGVKAELLDMNRHDLLRLLGKYCFLLSV